MGSEWLVTFNSAKTKLLSVNRYRNSDDIPISMADSVLVFESSSFRLLGLTFSKDLTWNGYIKFIAKCAAMKIESLYRARQYLSPECILFYKSPIRPCMKYCCHIWRGASADVLGFLDSIQKQIANIVGPTLAATLLPLSHHCDVVSLSLFYKYYHGRCSAELLSLVPPKVAKHVTRLSANSHPFTVVVPTCKKSFYSSSFFPRTSVLWNSLPLSCFPDSYDLHSFKSRANHFLSLNSDPF